jgi:glycosyltransferase involved in cell wall biosynthesis
MIAAATFPNPRLYNTDAESIRVVHVVLSLDVGGLERVVLSLADHGRRLGHQVSIVCVERPGALAQEARNIGAEVFCADKGPGLRLGVVGKIAKYFNGIRPDVVHTHQIAALLYAGRAARKAGVPAIVHTEHGKHYAKRWRTRMLGKVAARSAHRFFGVSLDIARDVARYGIAPPHRIAVVPNGIDPAAIQDRAGRDEVRRELGIPLDAPVVGTLGRLSEVKRQDLLISGFAKFRQRVPGAHLMLVGDGPMLGPLKKQVEELGLESCVHFAGYQASPGRYLHAMDLFVLTSESEGMPLAVLEAWAAGLAVVASRVGGLPEFIDHGRNGLLYTFGDEEALVDSMAQLMENRQEAERLAGAGLQLVQSQYTLQRTAETYDAAYRLLAGTAIARRR